MPGQDDGWWLFCYVSSVAVVCEVLKSVCEFSHQLSDTIVFGFATSHTASIEAGAGMCLCLQKD